MFKARFIHNGDSIDYRPPSGGADVAAGDVVVQGDLLGIAKLDIAAGTLGALAVKGVFDIAKATGADTAIAAGVSVYWDADGQQATADSNAGAHRLLGKAVAAADDADATVRVRLSQ